MNAKTETLSQPLDSLPLEDFEPMDDGLDAARGVMLAAGVGLLMWAAIIPAIIWVLR
jgi:hypothetical protein